MSMEAEIIFARQTSALDGFHYLVEDLNGSELGEIQWPMLAQAGNARLKFHADDSEAGAIKLRCGEANYLIQFDYLQRGWQNDTRYTLCDGDQIRASASIRFEQGHLKRGVMSLESPLQARFVRQGRWFRKCFDLIGPDGQTRLGRIEEPSAFSLRRRLRAELPGMSLPQKLFCLFLALHLIQTQA